MITQNSKFSMCELNNNMNCGTCILEIISIPKIDMFTDKENVLQVLSTNCLSLLSEIYQISKYVDSALEVLWIAEPVSGQTYNARIRLFIVIRIIDRDEYSANKHLLHLQSICINILKANKYTVKSINLYDNNFSELISNLNQKNMYAIVKDENITGTYCPVTSFYYSTDVIPNSATKQIGKLVETLTMYPYSAVSFQVIPTQFDEEEMDSISRAYYLLNKLAVGFHDDYYGEIRDNLAEQPQKIFEYYYNQFNKPLFLYNILVYSEETPAISIISRVSSQINEGDVYGESAKLIYNDLFDSKYSIFNDFFTLPWNINQILLYDKRNYRFWNEDVAPKSLFRLPYIITAEEAVSFIKFPVSVSDNMIGMNVTKFESTETYYSPEVIDANNIQLGYILNNGHDKNFIGINDKSLSKHMFISGTPGSGKTTFSFNILCQLKDKGIPFLVIEPAKSEYRTLIDVVSDLQVFTPGKNDVIPFIINPFIPPKNVKLQSYKSSLMTAFNAAFSNIDVFKLLFREAINLCYTEHGWRDNSTSDDKNVAIFGLFEFISTFKRIIETKKYSNEVKSNIESAGVLRLMDLINQDYSIFDSINTIPIEDLINKSTIIELDAIENIEQKSLIISLLLVSIFSYISANTNETTMGKTNFVLLLEEAHVLLASQKSKAITDGEANPNSIAVELVNRILAEKRSSGLGMIIADQSPQKVSIDVIKNTSTKIIFRAVEYSDRELIAKSTNMNESQKNSLSTLRNGEAYCYLETIDTPQIIQTINVRKEKGIRDYISDEIVRVNDKYWNDNSKKLRPYNECMIIESCNNSCDSCIRTEAKYISDIIFYNHIGADQSNKEPFLELAENINTTIEQYVQHNECFYKNNRLYNCVKIQLLRKIYQETVMGKVFNSRTRIEFMKNTGYMKGV